MRTTIPLSEKYNLTVSEASQYFNIGQDKLRKILDDNPDFIMMNGVKVLVKRKKFEKYLDEIFSI